jgi:transcriptional regulator with XRE-family HTH domain
MSRKDGLNRRAHFLGTKFRALRKRHNLTLEDLSVRCIQVDAESAPSVSYLSMIENGKRVPSAALLKVVAGIFQKNPDWFFDETLDEAPLDTAPESAVSGIPLEPGFLFSENLLQRAIPELLAQTGTTGRQFAHLLIRAHQEANHNRFPDLERVAERIGKKRFPMQVEDLLRIADKLGLEIRWFDSRGFTDERAVVEQPSRTLIRSFFEAPNRICINEALRDTPARLKFDLANHIGHKVLHDGDGARAPQVSGGYGSDRRYDGESANVDAKDILYAWRDFECSYFAAALLAPKTPFRQFLARHAYALDAAPKAGLTTTLHMRRMSSVSPYPHWHYFDAYPPGNLRAVYRGNGIPLPWGNMTSLSDPCRHWAVFRMLQSRSNKPSAQISILRNGSARYLYCCQSIRNRDAAGNPHVLCAGVDLAPALQAQGTDPAEAIAMIEDSCNANGGSGPIPREALRNLESISKILNIGWIADGCRNNATIICPRSSGCPRDRHCLGAPARKATSRIEDIRRSLALSARAQ